MASLGFKCPQCGATLRSATESAPTRPVKCPKCGTSFSVAVASPAPTHPVVLVDDEPERAVKRRSAKKKEHKALTPLSVYGIIGACVGVVVLLVVLIVAFWPTPGARDAQPRVVVGPHGRPPGLGMPDDERMPTLSVGTGFLIGKQGHVLTNFHVVNGEGPIFVQIPTKNKPIQAHAERRAFDPTRDMALLEIDVPEGLTLRPLRLAASRKIRRGENVIAFGYPIQEGLSAKVKLTGGLVSALPDRGNDQMFELDIRVNPGNSGGPLCSYHGGVVGMVTAKTRADETTDSFGLALPTPELLAFVKQHVPDYESSPEEEKELKAAEVADLVSPSVVLIVQDNRRSLP